MMPTRNKNALNRVAKYRKIIRAQLMGLLADLSVTEAVPCSADCVHQRIIKVAIDFLAQSRNMNVNYVCLRVKVITPNMLQQHPAGNNLASVSHQIFEQPVFPRLQ